MTSWYSLVAAAALATTPVSGGQNAPPAIELAAKRFLRGDATLVDAFCRVPFGMLTPIAVADGDAGGAYRFDVSVRDADGTVLLQQDWSQSVGKQFLAMSGASTVEHIAFSVPTGTYSIAVVVTDSASGRSDSTSVELAALGVRTHVSDLYLTSEIRRASSAEDTSVAPGEIKKGSLLLTSNTVPVLTPRSSDLYYYLELYPGVDTTVTIAARVLKADGSPVVPMAPAQIEVGAGGGVAARALPLAGLPKGEYRLEVTVGGPGGDVVREARFAMAGIETVAAIAEATRGAAEDPFAQMTEVQLDSLYAPLVYLMESNERGVYDGLSVDGKRNYMRQFWDRRDPSPGTPANEARDAFYQLMREASRRFRESGAGDVPGWRTDRGRVFLKHGEPEEVLRRPNFGQNQPYEVWKYTRPRNLKYLFIDQTGLGNYVLVYTTDRFETSRGDWQTLLTADAVDDVLRY